MPCQHQSVPGRKPPGLLRGESVVKAWRSRHFSVPAPRKSQKQSREAPGRAPNDPQRQPESAHLRNGARTAEESCPKTPQDFLRRDLIWRGGRRRRSRNTSAGNDPLLCCKNCAHARHSPRVRSFSQANTARRRRWPKWDTSIGNSSDDRQTNFQLKYRSEEHTSELQSRLHLVCRLLLEKKKKKKKKKKI